MTPMTSQDNPRPPMSAEPPKPCGATCIEVVNGNEFVLSCNRVAGHTADFHAVFAVGGGYARTWSV